MLKKFPPFRLNGQKVLSCEPLHSLRNISYYIQIIEELFVARSVNMVTLILESPSEAVKSSSRMQM